MKTTRQQNRKPLTFLAAAGFLASFFAGCERAPVAAAAVDAGPVVFTDKEIGKVLELSPLPGLPPSPTNAVADDPAAARLGQQLFFDERLSANGQVSCATCHDPAHGFSDAKPLAEGLQTTTRHSQALWNVAYQRWFFWDGRADSLWAQSLQPLQSEAEMGVSPRHVLQVIEDDEKLANAYKTVFGSLPDPPPASSGEDGGDASALDAFFANVGKAIEAYERHIISRDSPFDQFVSELRVGKQDSTALSEPARRGLRLFVGRGNCVLCHAGPNLSDGEFHNIGLPKHPELPRDQGRFVGIRKLQADPFNGLGALSDDRTPEVNVKLRYLAVKMNNLGEMKTPSLRHVAETAPYMHDGRFATLREVLDFYSELPDQPPVGHREETLQPLEFTDGEKADLEAFLRSLTGAPLPPSLLIPPGDADAETDASGLGA